MTPGATRTDQGNPSGGTSAGCFQMCCVREAEAPVVGDRWPSLRCGDREIAGGLGLLAQAVHRGHHNGVCVRRGIRVGGLRR